MLLSSGQVKATACCVAEVVGAEEVEVDALVDESSKTVTSLVIENSVVAE